MADLIVPQVLKGFRDSLPAQEIPKKKLMARLETVFESFGFAPIDTPVLEYTEVLLGKGGGETDKQVYRFEDHGARDVSMRFDLTVPFARFMAAHAAELALPFKRYHMAKVWRGENTQRGRYREFVQCDFDIVGADSAAADFEILLMMTRAMDVLVGGKATICLSHRGIFNALLEQMGVRDQSVAVLRAVDKLGKIGVEGVRPLLETSLSPEQARQILDFVSTKGTFVHVLSKLESLIGGPTDDTNRLRILYETASSLRLESRFVLDPSITRGLDYYTGIVYETFLDELPTLGSVMSGGRYNNLAALYTKQELPGVGASVGLDRLLAGLAELGTLQSSPGVAQVLVLTQGRLVQEYRLAEGLRTAGLNVELAIQERKLPQQYKLAEARGIRFVAQSMGESTTFQVKDTQSGETRTDLSLEAAAAWVRRNQP